MKCRAKHSLGYDKAHCEPYDWVKTNQWVCALTLRFVRITIESFMFLDQHPEVVKRLRIIDDGKV